MVLRHTFSFAAALLWLSPLASAQSSADTPFSWPQWDGPDRTGISKETAWESEGKPESLWDREFGLGYSTVAVANGSLLTMGYDKETGLDTIYCLDPITGETQWDHSYPSEIWDLAHEGGTVNTPSIDGDVVYSLNREGNFFCIELDTGEIRWHTMLKPEDNPHELEYPRWGFSASPLVLEDDLIVNCGRLLSIDKETGEVLWASRDFGHGYGTPIAFEYDDEPMIAVHNNGEFAVVGLENGTELFALPFGGKQRGINAATPVLLEGNDLFISSGMMPGCARVSLAGDDATTVWQNREMVSSFSGCVLVDDGLFGFDGSELKCINTDGDECWSERGIGNGAVTAAGDRLLVMGGTGELIVAKATAEKFNELSRAPLFEEGRYWTKPILVNGIIYCRSSKGRMVARDHRVGQPE